jgi:hypothetical protein
MNFRSKVTILGWIVMFSGFIFAGFGVRNISVPLNIAAIVLFIFCLSDVIVEMMSGKE